MVISSFNQLPSDVRRSVLRGLPACGLPSLSACRAYSSCSALFGIGLGGIITLFARNDQHLPNSDDVRCQPVGRLDRGDRRAESKRDAVEVVAALDDVRRRAGRSRSGGGHRRARWRDDHAAVARAENIGGRRRAAHRPCAFAHNHQAGVVHVHRIRLVRPTGARIGEHGDGRILRDGFRRI